VIGGTSGYMPTPPPQDDVAKKVKLAFAQIENNYRVNFTYNKQTAITLE